MRRGRRYRLGAGAWNREEDVEMGEMSKSAGTHTGAMFGEQAHIGPLREKRRLCWPESSKGESCPQCLNSNLQALHRNLREQPKKKKKKFRAVYQPAYVQTRCCLSLGDKFLHALSWPPATPQQSAHSSINTTKVNFLCLCVFIKRVSICQCASLKLPVSFFFFF